MVLKKNNRQITFLHVYHHASTFFPVWWAVMKYGPGGDAWFCCFLNSSIHVLMYGYYLAASCGIKLTLIKPLITMSQMIQFICFIVQVRARISVAVLADTSLRSPRKLFAFII